MELTENKRREPRDNGPEAKKRRGLHDNVQEVPSHECGQEDLDFVHGTSQEELCVAGSKVALKPHTTSCGHTYCGDLVQVMKREGIHRFVCIGQDNNSPNGLCRRVIVSSALRLDKPLDRHINDKVIQCPNAYLGCTMILKLRLLHQHLDCSCVCEKVICSNCNRLVPKGSLPKHRIDCRLGQSQSDNEEEGGQGPGCMEHLQTSAVNWFCNGMITTCQFLTGKLEPWWQRCALLPAENDSRHAISPENYGGRADSDGEESVHAESFWEQPWDDNSARYRSSSF